MSITTYSELQTAVADFLNRDDLSAVVPTFIALAEADMSRRIRHWQMERRSTADVSSRFTAIPDVWIETISFGLTTSYLSRLEPISRADMLSRREDSNDATGRPAYFCMTDGQFEVFPTPDGTYASELLYYTNIPALSGLSTTNWVLDDHPDAYLYGALVHSAPYLANDERLQVWGSFYNAAIESIQRTGTQASVGGSGLRMKTRAMS